MLCTVILVLFGSSQINAYFFDNSTALEVAEDGRALSGGGAVTAGTLQWIVSIHDVSATTAVYKAPGVAYNANWVLTTQGAVTTYLSAAEIIKLGLYVNLANAGTIASERRHRIKDFKTPATLATPLARATIKHDLVALKVCPPLTTFATIGTAAASASAFGTAATYVTFTTSKEQLTSRRVGATCQCAHYTNYDANYHFCLDEDDNNHLVTGDGKAVVCIIGGNFAGFNVDVQNAGGEPYLDIYQYETPFLSTLT